MKMSVTQTGERTRVAENRERDWVHQEARETKPSFMTTEFWAMVVGIAAVIVIYNASSDASLDLWRATAICAAIAIGYFISRGLAKSGSRDTYEEHDRRRG
jgi:hypothetical protein